jgi:DNA-directed RNA polymerase II subunit RPB2
METLKLADQRELGLNPRQILDAWYAAHPYFLSQHHLNSFDQFVDTRIKAAIKSMNPLTMVKKVQESGIFEVNVFVGGRESDAWYLDRPTLPDGRLLYPNNARLMNVSYTSTLAADIVVEYSRDGKHLETREFSKVRIGVIPIMLHSSLCVLRDQAPAVLRDMGECPFDQGGYFIISGKEKVLVAQERIAYNRLFITPVPRKSEADRTVPFSHDAFVRCMGSDDLFPKLLRFRIFVNNHAKRKNAIVCYLPHVQGDIPLFALFRMLGLEADADILSLILGSSVVDEKQGSKTQIVDFLHASVVDCGRHKIWTQAQAVGLLSQRAGNKTAKQVKSILVNSVLPNAGPAFDGKLTFLAHLVRKIVGVRLGVLLPTERDSWVHKRMDLSGFLVADLFRDVYRRFRVEAMNRMDQEFLSGPWRHTGDFAGLISRNNLTRIFDGTIIEQGLIRSFKGAWNFDERNPEASRAYARTGIVQDLTRLTYQGYLSHIRRVSTAMSTQVKLVAPHRLYAAQWGAVCPVDSPDGANVGLLKHFTVLCHITGHRDSARLNEHLVGVKLVSRIQVSAAELLDSTRQRVYVFANHGLLGTTEHPHVLVTYVRMLRRTGLLAPDVSVTWNVVGHEISILTDAGRTCRPLMCLPEHPRASEFGTWSRLVSGTLLDERDLPREFVVVGSQDSDSNQKESDDACARPDIFDKHAARGLADVPDAIRRLGKFAGPVELIDSEELTTVLIEIPNQLEKTGIRTRPTHREIHAATMFSHMTASIPMLDHNPAAYNSLCIAQTKQGIGLYSSAFMHRADVSGLVLHSTQLPLVTSYFADKLCGGQLTHGENVIVAIATYSGYNQEDALVVNRTSVERGLLNISAFSTLTFSEESSWDKTSRVVFANPLQLASESGLPMAASKAERADLSSLRPDGLPREGTHITEGSPIIGMVGIEAAAAASLSPESPPPKLTDATQLADKTTWGTVDRVFVMDAPLGSRIAKVRLHEVRLPDLGDKLASRYGQKGVVGMLIPQADMPFTADGMVPDVIINPNGFPKRMTVGHILEALLGRVACDCGTRLDATTFDGADPVAAATAYFMGRPPGERWSTTGDTVLYNGRTGSQMDVRTFVGVNYYNRLKHMAVDKINYRGTGPRNVMTHQPTQGRGNGGGLKIGEMEQHAITSHGLASFLKESFCERSDAFRVPVDERSGILAPRGGTQLPAGVSGVVRAPIPYSFNQLTHELAAMAIGVRVQVE